jgi:pimeloyl-ACP methyl ester carboxylesterase
MWDPQVAALSASYRCIAYDLMGHGGSAPGPGGYTLEDEAENLHELIARWWGASPAHVVALSMGGMTAIRLALDHPEDVLSLSLFDTSAEGEDPSRIPQYEALLAGSRGPNVAVIAEAVAAIMFSQGFRASRPEVVADYRRHYASLDFDAIELALKAVTGRSNVLPAAAAISVPTLVVVGSEDPATPPDEARRLADAVPGARLETLAGAGHMSVIEQPERVTEMLSAFLAQVEGGSAK